MSDDYESDFEDDYADDDFEARRRRLGALRFERGGAPPAAPHAPPAARRRCGRLCTRSCLLRRPAPPPPARPPQDDDEAARKLAASPKAAAAASAPPPPAGPARVGAPRLTDAQRRALGKTLQAARALAGRVRLSQVALGELLGAPAQSDAQLFAQGRGPYARLRAGTTQTQLLGRDAAEAEAQTEGVPSAAAGCQVPDDRAADAAAGGREEITAIRAAARRKARGPYPNLAVPGAAPPEGATGARLAEFMAWAGAAVAGVLAAARGAPTALPPPARPLRGALSAGATPLALPELLAGRPVVALAHGPHDPNALLAAYGSPHADPAAALADHGLSGRGLCCVWDVAAPGWPRAALLSEALPTAAAWLPCGGAQLVAAGLDDGGVCVWDLRERASRHAAEVVGGERLPLRAPAYSTEQSAGVATSGGPVVALAVVPARDGGGAQLLALSCWGQVRLFGVQDLGGGGGGGDAGMRPGSRVRLLLLLDDVRYGLTLRRRLPDAAAAASGDDDGAAASAAGPAEWPACADLAALPGGGSGFLVAADAGRVLRGGYSGPTAPPKAFRYDPRFARPSAAAAGLAATAGGGALGGCAARVTCLAASPFAEEVFAAGQSDGAVLIYSARASSPALAYLAAGRGGILAVRWSPARPCILLALDAAGDVLAFDLAGAPPGGVGAGPSARATAQELGAPGPAVSLDVSPRSKRGAPGTMALGFADGSAARHVLAEALQAPGRGGAAAELSALRSAVGLLLA